MSDEEMMRDVLDFFNGNLDRYGAKTVYAALITRRTHRNPLTADSFTILLIDKRGYQFSYWNFLDMENMMEWLGSSITLGFGDEKPEWIEERLWDSLLAFEEETLKHGY